MIAGKGRKEYGKFSTYKCLFNKKNEKYNIKTTEIREKTKYSFLRFSN